MPRLSPDDLKHCINTGRCLDCYQKHEDTLATKRQKRGRLEVPCCYKHFYAHKNKISEAAQGNTRELPLGSVWYASALLKAAKTN